MITHKNLIELGYIHLGHQNNRDFYSKAGFEIMLHLGEVNQLSSNGVPKSPTFETYPELERHFKQWAIKKTKEIENTIGIMEKQKELLTNFVKYSIY